MPSYDQLPENSESLLTQILELLQTLNSSVESFEEKLTKIESDVASAITRIDTIIRDGFPDGDLLKHKGWHLKSVFNRLLNR